MRSASASVMLAKTRRAGGSFAVALAGRGELERAEFAIDLRVENRQPCQANMPRATTPNTTKEIIVDVHDAGRERCQLICIAPGREAFEPNAGWKGCDAPQTDWSGCGGEP